MRLPISSLDLVQLLKFSEGEAVVGKRGCSGGGWKRVKSVNKVGRKGLTTGAFELRHKFLFHLGVPWEEEFSLAN